MKQLLKPLSILLLVIISALWTSASAVEIDGIYYYLHGNEATVTNKGQNSYSNRSDNYANSYSGAITIPSTITHNGKTFTVTQIQAYAFYKCPDLKTISIPSTVSSIEIADAKEQISSYFSGDASFKAFIVSTDNPNYTAIGGILFNKDKTSLLKCPQAKTGDFTVPSTVKTFGRYAFEECNSLNSIELPNSITSIGDYVFFNCYSIKSINIPTELTELGDLAFYGCSSLSEIVIPSGIKKIPDFVFGHCLSLTSITIPEGIEEIGNGAFCGCSKLTEVVLPSTVKKLGEGCFRECTNLSKINIPEGITEIQEQTFYKCDLTSITLPESVTSIGKYAFYLNRIPIVDLPKSITNIGELAFYSYYLQDVYIYNFPYVCSYSNYNSFNTNFTLRIHVYPPLVDTYKTNEYWHSYADYIIGDIPVEHPIKNIVLNHTSLAMNSYTEGKLTATIKPDNASVKEVIYTSSNEEAVIILDDTGRFMTLGAGTATITATAADGSGVKATCKVTVTEDVKVANVTLNKKEVTIKAGNTQALTATVSPSNATIKSVTWKSSNPKVATVNENGVVTGVSAGTATITATAADGSGVNATCKVTVTEDIKVASVTLNKKEITIKAGSTQTLTATISPSNATIKSLTWKSSNSKVATVDGNGVVTGISAGTATITATATDGSGIKATCKVNVIYNSIALTDASTSYSNDTEATVNPLEYTRIFNNTDWQALYIPFSMSYDDWKDYFDIARIDGIRLIDKNNDGIINETILDIVKIEEGTITANTPYLIKPKETGEKTISISNTILYKSEENGLNFTTNNATFTFIGNYSTISASTLITNNYYTIDGGSLIITNGSNGLQPFRWYLKVESQGSAYNTTMPIAINVIGEENASTGIEESLIMNDKQHIYDLNGRVVNEKSLKSGIYIRNGKKVIIR